MIHVRLSLQFPALEAGVRQMLGSDPEIVLVDGDTGDDTPGSIEAADVHIMASAVFARQRSSFDRDGETSGIIVLGADGLDTKELWARSAPWGILPMEVTAQELRAAVHSVAAGLIVGPAALLSSPDDTPIGRGPLTEREVEILGVLSRGLANKQVAAELGISEHTVKFHVSSIYTKLNVSNRTEAVREGLRNGWIAL